MVAGGKCWLGVGWRLAVLGDWMVGGWVAGWKLAGWVLGGCLMTTNGLARCRTVRRLEPGRRAQHEILRCTTSATCGPTDGWVAKPWNPHGAGYVPHVFRFVVYTDSSSVL